MSVDVTLLVGLLVRYLRPAEVDTGQLWHAVELVDRAVRVLGVEATMPDDSTADAFLACVAAGTRYGRPDGPGRHADGMTLLAGGRLRVVAGRLR